MRRPFWPAGNCFRRPASAVALFALCLLLVPCLAAGKPADRPIETDTNDLTALSIEDLMNIEVQITLASKRSEKSSGSPWPSESR